MAVEEIQHKVKTETATDWIKNEQPTGQPTEQPTEYPAEQLTERPADWLKNEQETEHPAEQSAEQSAERLTEHPNEKLVEHPADWLKNGHPTEQPTEDPTELQTEYPTDWVKNKQSAEPPAELRTVLPAEQLNELPVKQPVEHPAAQPTELPVELQTKNSNQQSLTEQRLQFGITPGKFTSLIDPEGGVWTPVKYVINIIPQADLSCKNINVKDIQQESVPTRGDKGVETKGLCLNVQKTKEPFMGTFQSDKENEHECVLNSGHIDTRGCPNTCVHDEQATKEKFKGPLRSIIKPGIYAGSVGDEARQKVPQVIVPERLPRKYKKEKLRKCHICQKQFLSEEYLRRHIRWYHSENHHEGEKKMFRSKPQEVPQPIKEKPVPERLTRKFKKEKLRKCHICQKQYFSEVYLQRHIRWYHSEDEGEKKMFRSKPRHMKIKPCDKEKKRHQCSVCEKMFTYECVRDKHMRMHSGEIREKPYQCSICGLTYFTRSSLAIHLKRHSGEKPFGCSICDKRFVERGLLNRHIVTHSERRPWACTLCELRFKSKSCLDGHMKTHSGQKLHGCNFCGKKFKRNWTCRKHMRTHGEQVHLSFGNGKKVLGCVTNTMKPEVAALDRQYGCSICGREFIHKLNLASHMVSHRDERPFACNVCDRRFKTKNHLDSHMITHREKKPYECSTCGKKFVKKWYLTSHTYTHSEDRPYGCNSCDKKFKSKKEAVKHQKIHGPKQHGCSICGRRFHRNGDLTKHVETHKEKPNKC